MQTAFARAGVPAGRVGSILTPFFAPRAPENYAQAAACDTRAFARYFNAMLQAGIYVAPSQFEAMFLSAAHTPEHLSATERAIAHAVSAARAAEK